MAAVEKSELNPPKFVAPPGMEVIDRGYASADIEAGDPVVISTALAPSALYDCVVDPAGDTEGHGIALKSVRAGGLCEFASQGEIDGYVGLTPGAGLTIVGGLIDDTAPAVGEFAQIRAVNESRIRFVMV